MGKEEEREWHGGKNVRGRLVYEPHTHNSEQQLITAYAPAVARTVGQGEQGRHLLVPAAVPLGAGRLRAGEAEKRDVFKRVKRCTPHCSETAWFTAICKTLISDHGAS